MSLEFLNEAANVVLVGPNGVGKSTIAANIAHRAVLKGHTVRFATAASMLGELAALDSDTLLQRRLRFYARQHLLVIDESDTCPTATAMPICCSTSSPAAASRTPP